MSLVATKTAAPTSGTLAELLKRWEASLALHARYSALDDERYRHVQPWPRHERPARWIIRLAQDKLRVLTEMVATRRIEGDRTFLEALELMGFLATLVGLSNVERFVPLCDPAGERREVLEAQPPPEDPTREMPQLPTGQMARMLLAQKVGVPYRAESEARRASPKKRSAESAPGSHKRSLRRVDPSQIASDSAARTAGPKGLDALIVDDALRLLGWGRVWHELPDIIARLADRPPVTAVRRVLREHRALIERRHGIQGG